MASKCLKVAKLLRSNRSLTVVASPFAGRYHSFHSSVTASDHTCSLCSLGESLGCSSASKREHPFLTQILKPNCRVQKYSLVTIVKLEMPGVSKKGLNLEIKNNVIHVEGKTEKHGPGTIYSGVVDVPPGLYNTDQINVSMKFGVLEFVIPRLKPTQMDRTQIWPKYEPMINFRHQY